MQLQERRQWTAYLRLFLSGIGKLFLRARVRLAFGLILRLDLAGREWQG